MNLVFIIVVILLILYAIKGRQQGFIRILFTMVSTVIALVTAALFTPYISGAIQSSDAIMEFVTGVPEEEVGNNRNIEETNIPLSVIKALGSGDADELKEALETKEVQEYVRVQLGIVIVNASVFFLLYLVARLILWSLCNSLDIVSHLPVINTVNKTAGIVAGLAQGVVNIWILCVVLNIFRNTETGEYIFKCIGESSFLSFLYSNNIFNLLGEYL